MKHAATRSRSPVSRRGEGRLRKLCWIFGEGDVDAQSAGGPIGRDKRIAELESQHAHLVREKGEALLALSAASFNRPGVHDSAHSNPAFRRWRECSDGATLIEAEIARIEDAPPER